MRNLNFKKVFCAVITITMLLSCALVNSNAKTIVRGDVNGDGKVQTSDARLALRAAALLELLDDNALIAADVDEDGKVQTKDARTILRVAAELEKFENPEIVIEDATDAEEPTTEEPTTEEPTTEEPTTEEPTTEEPTTEEPTTEEPTTEEPTTEEPTTEEPTTEEPTTEEPTTEEPTTEEPTTEEPTTEEPTTEEPTTEEPTTEEPTTEEPTTEEPTTEEPTTEEPTTEEPTTEEPTTEEPTTEEPTTEEPTTEEPTTEEPTTEEPTTEEPTTEEPTTEEPTTEEPTTENTAVSYPKAIDGLFENHYYMELESDGATGGIAKIGEEAELTASMDGLDMSIYISGGSIYLKYDVDSIFGVMKYYYKIDENSEMASGFDTSSLLSDYDFGSKDDFKEITSYKETLDGVEYTVYSFVSEQGTSLCFFADYNDNIKAFCTKDAEGNINNDIVYFKKLSYDIPDGMCSVKGRINDFAMTGLMTYMQQNGLLENV